MGRAVNRHHHPAALEGFALREGPHHATIKEPQRLTLLEPAIIQAILAGTQPRCMSLIWFQRNPLPLDWIEQRRVVDGFDA